MRALVLQFAKFGAVGILATIIDFGVMILLHECLGIDAIYAAALSFIIALVFNYVASMRYVFKRREDISRSLEMTIFVILSVIGLGINELVMLWGKLFLEARGIPFEDGFVYIMVKVFATGLVMLWNFYTRKKFLEQH